MTDLPSALPPVQPTDDLVERAPAAPSAADAEAKAEAGADAKAEEEDARDPAVSVADLRSRLADLMLADQRRLTRRLELVGDDPAQRPRHQPEQQRDRHPGRDGQRQRQRQRGRRGGQGATPVTVESVAREVEDAERRIARRRTSLPRPTYPANLPVTAKKDAILAAIRDNQVVVVAGETGSGKSTQLPKICLELGRGVTGLIGHTQPRRIAARTLAERVADELGTPVGGIVGYTVRFTDQVGEDTLVKLMTDGILLAEIQRDRDLSRYDTLIIDEAHERSLNIDFILGYLKQLLPRRPDLKVVITSATIDTERFARHFGQPATSTRSDEPIDQHHNAAPVVDVSGRTYPVEVRYRPLEGETGDDVDRDQIQAICEGVEELRAEGTGDILVFLSGEREIRDTADALRAMDLPDTEILPLYARLSFAEQHRVFQPHRGRRIVLATNVAETSLTVPGIRYVIDPGTARISRYNRRTKVQRLPIEPVSQASANQRAGRCGRLGPGICLRLYSDADFEARPEFTEPEILRTNLASVILQMAALGLGEIASFPFVDPPEARNIRDGVSLLEELGALDPEHQGTRRWLTPLGRRLAQLPLDPRLGRMILEAERHGCLREVIVVAAALSIQDPRERPTGREQIAAEKHSRFAHKESDFLGYLQLWEYLQTRQRELSSSQFRRMCKAELLNFLRVREWQDITAQLRQVTKAMGLPRDRGRPAGPVSAESAHPDHVHQSLLAGLLSHIGLRDDTGRNARSRRDGGHDGRRAARRDRGRAEYAGARNARFAIAAGSPLAKRPPRWVMAAELVETNRLWARMVAPIRPEWAEQLGAHLVKRSHGEPQWDPVRGEAVTAERVTLYGVPVVASRMVAYGRVDPADARALFLRHALVEGDWHTHHEIFDANRKVVDEVRALEDRTRRRDVVLGDDALYHFYDERVGTAVTSARELDRWWKEARRAQPDLLTFSVDAVVDPDSGPVDLQAYPDVWHHRGLALPLTYEFDPASPTDGVTVHVPVAVLNQVAAAGFDWQIPGLRAELVGALVRTLPKDLRRQVLPVGEFAATFADRAGPEDGPLLEVLSRELRRRTGDPVPADAWQLDRVPEHLKMTFRVEDAHGRVLGSGKDLAELERRFEGHMRRALSEATQAGEQVVERAGLHGWDLDRLPRVVEARRAGQPVRAYPALIDEGDSVAVRLLPSAAEQERAMARGTRRLLRLSLPSPVRALRSALPAATTLALASAPHGSAAAVYDDCVDAALDDLVAKHGGPAWDAAGFGRLRDAVRNELTDTSLAVATAVGRVLGAQREVDARLSRLTAPGAEPARADVRRQLGRLVHPGFATRAGLRRLPDLVRYLRAIEHRLDKLGNDPLRDRERMARAQRLEAEYEELRGSLTPDGPVEEVESIRWMLEELRVSLFAQALGTDGPVSEERILRAMDDLTHLG